MMENPLKEMDYPGRGVFLGVTAEEGDVFAGTFVEGRSPSSQARKYVREAGMVRTAPTDPKVLAGGNPELLLYNALMWYGDVIVASNGRQSDSIMSETLCSLDPLGRPSDVLRPLVSCAAQWNYEPDDPNFTPRVHGRIVMNPANYSNRTMELGIISRGDEGAALRMNYPVSPEPGTAAFISTYTGENLNPLPSFRGVPRVIPVTASRVEDICAEIGEMLKPELRVGVAAVMLDMAGDYSSAVLNYRE